MVRKTVILEHGGGELANQLWNYVSVYAYALERGAAIENPSFFEYESMFRMPRSRGFAGALAAGFRTYRGRRNRLAPRLGRFIYKAYAKSVALANGDAVLSSENSENRTYVLPPSAPADAALNLLEARETIYFKGWLFRNPAGLEKHRTQIIERFHPSERIESEVHDFIRSARAHYAHVFGVHLRQGDYATFKGGKYLIDQTRVRQIMDEYVAERGISREQACFVICSDGKIDQDIFNGFNIRVSNMSAVHDLFLLSETDVVLGSDSSFGDFAAWYGNIPHIVLQKESMDWEYYRGRTEFFENKYCTMVHY